MRLYNYIINRGKDIVKVAFSVIALTAITACTDEEIRFPDEGEKPGIAEEIGDAIAFTVKLDKDMSTRANGIEAYDNYIDTQNKFRILFFTQYGDFLFGAIDRTVTSLGTDAESSNWYVRIPMNYIVDREGNEYPIEKLKAYLRSNPFKVAILANWPDVDSEGEPAAYKSREPNWGYKNSYLYDPTGDDKDKANKIGSKELKNINNLHHLQKDTYYTDNKTDKRRPYRNDVYDFIMEDGKMGIKSDWVKMRDNGTPEKFESKEQAEDWIRKYLDPLKDQQGTDRYREYSNLWQLWDFDASCKSYDGDYDDENNWIDGDYSFYNNTWGKNDKGESWFRRNGSKLKDWLYYTNGKEPIHSDGAQLYNERSGVNAIDGLSYIPSSNPFYFHKKNNHYGLVLTPAEKEGTGDDAYIHSSKSKGYLMFTAPATGTYRIKCGVRNGGTGTLIVQRSTNRDRKYTISGEDPVNISYENSNLIPTAEYNYRDLSLTEDPEPIYIWSLEGDIIIYAIEWICAKYLYDTDREGIAPSEDYPIPMYGVQQFSALTDWKEGTTKDISAPIDEKKETIYVSLIRALAKVEVYIPDQVKHIYMRSMNRVARCEPMDVESSTGLLWKDHTTETTFNSANHCEWFDIQKYGTFFENFNKELSDDKTQQDSYTSWMAWFHWSWKTAKWTNNNGTYSGWDFDTHNDVSYSQSYKVSLSTPTHLNTLPAIPHLFNPDIERSDFCHMLDAGTVNGYHKYVLYMPDKNISDPNYPGIKQSIAKVAHIEYRYTDNTDYLEDNNCYRIYFTDYSTNSTIRGLYADEYEDPYERNLNNLNQHWPIMRNHIYRFYVGGPGSYRQPIRVEVNDWGYEKINVEW